ncbi:hypothetical protein DYU02_02235 [Listeria monocytogenes]|uniref:Uncharacterized protein n=1 Tax=Listeria monocytogenes TaxID=1639 RepID=A0A9P1SZG5_LISMN|nr:hypothetical protein [Listeria monocytogenes]EAC2245319.1 hypothetical protein [Listeria monocytogenes]EAC2291244.1 hypothetical protein [Listeria monocytogenes]EAC2302609.1 hypothetical protein [Listeria monocytogenes]EAC4360135.1 hypothetical protein [Listeria monocytogenes]EAC5550222.1 hypothetical protein [Listeria monocytogenes]
MLLSLGYTFEKGAASSKDTYQRILLDGLRYFDMELRDIENMTLSEYQLRIKAYRLKDLDRMKDLHLAAWLNHQAGATNKKGKPFYKEFKDFFNFEEEQRKILHPEPQIKNKKKLQKIAMNLKKYREEVKHV